MREVHDGILYDTDDAELLGRWNPSLGTIAALYRTTSGRYFVADEGVTFGGNQIYPSEDEKALIRWLENNRGHYLITQHFANHIEQA